MHLVSLIIDGFKSYGGRTVISGFDTEFNAIVGPNGSGKSVLLDSICFVLGISSLAQVRATSLDDLIYKQGLAGVTKASVTLVFDNSNPATSPHGYEQLDQITVTRQIAKGGRNKYQVNGLNAQLQRVQNLFHSVQLNVNNPHFLVMQGHIRKVSDMKPPELLGMIEEAAGTRMFENKKLNCLKTMEKKDTKIVEIDRVMQEDIKPRLEKLRAQRTQYVEFNDLAAEIESTAMLSHAYAFHKEKLAAKALSEGAAADVAARADIEARLTATEGEDARLAAALRETLHRKKAESGGELKQREEAEKALGEQLVKVTAEHAQLQQEYDADATELAATDASLAELGKEKAKAEAEQAKAKAAVDKAAGAAEAKAAAAAEAQAAYEAAMGLGGSSGGGEGAKNLQGQLSDAVGEASAQETELKAQQMKAKHLGKEIKEGEKKLAEARKSGGKVEKEHAALQAEVSALRSQLEAAGFDESKEGALASALAAKQAAHAEAARREEAAGQGVSHYDFKYADPAPSFDRSRVKGTVASNLKVRDEKHTTALEALAGGRLHQVIVDDDKTGMLLLTKGKLQRRVTLIALNKVEPRTLPAAKLAAARNLVGAKKVHLALELLAYAPEVGPAMAHVFGETLVCDDKEAARAVCDALKLKTVTLEGDLFDPSGTLTGGSRARSTNSLLARLSLLAESRKELYALEAEVSSLRAQLDECRASAEKLSGLSSNLEVKVHQLSLHAEQLRSSPVGQLDESLTKLKGQLKEAEEAAEAAKGAKASAEARKAELTAQLKDMEGNRDDMMKRLKGAMDAGGKEAQKALKAQQKEQALLQKAAEGLAANESEASAADEKRAELGKRLEAQTASLEAKAAAEQAKRDAYDEAKAALTACEKALGAYDKEAAKIGAQREKIEKERQEGGEELTRIEHRAKGVAKEVAAHEGACKQLLKLHPWMATEQV